MAEQSSSGAPTPKRDISEKNVPGHLRGELNRLQRRIDEGDPLWPAQLAVGIAIALHLTLQDKLIIGPRWLIPAVEGLLLVTLVVYAPSRASRLEEKHRPFLWAILALVTLTYLVSLGLLVHYLVTGGEAGGDALIGSGVVLWVTNVLLFSVIYWELDRGGPLNRFRQRTWPDFQFPQMENPEFTPMGKEWRPGFVDYLYTSLTCATAFSPTDTMPITETAKALMGIQGTAAIVTLGLVVARAVNILG
jgi:hypothetical protein